MNINLLNYVTVLLVVLQLTDLIDISWWLVFAPSLFWLALYVIAIILVLQTLIKYSMTMEEFNKMMNEKKTR